MKLRTLQLTNFRCFESLTVEFDPQLTVFAAGNGAGKTAVLDSIAIGLSVFMQKLPFKRISSRTPKNTDFWAGRDIKSTRLRICLDTRLVPDTIHIFHTVL